MHKINELKVLDVTFRDGGYLNNFDFSAENIIKITNQLIQNGIDIVEIGYRNGSFKRDMFTGNTALLNNEFLEKIVPHIDASKVCVMVHSHNITHADIQEIENFGIKMARVCVSKNHLSKNLETINSLKSEGFFVTGNITRISSLSENEKIYLSRSLGETEVDVLYIADSNGAMLPDNVKSTISLIKVCCPHINIGFHAHNNLHLALANSISAIQQGASWVDVSLGGIGKGGGNLPLELLVGFLERYSLNNKYDIKNILELSDNFINNIDNINSTCSNRDIMMGAFNLSIDEYYKIQNVAKDQSISFYSAALLNKQQ